MASRTRNERTALQRLAEHVGASLLKGKKKGEVRVKVRDGVPARSGKPNAMLAMLASIALTSEAYGGFGMDVEEVREVTGFQGCSTQKLTGWEELTLMSLLPEEAKAKNRDGRRRR